MATCILRRQLNTWIDLEMISLFVQIRKEKRDPPSTISVSSAWHLPEVQTHSPKKKVRSAHSLTFVFFRLAPAQPQKKKKASETLIPVN